jgi:hypothetical protein
VDDSANPADLLTRLCAGMWAARLVQAAAGLGIADALPDGQPTPVAEIAAATGTDPHTLDRVMRALAAQGVFASGDDGCYVHSDLSRALRRDGPSSMLSLVLMSAADWNWSTWARLSDSIRSGQPGFPAAHGKDLWTHFAEDEPAAGTLFQQAMTDFARQTDAALADALAPVLDRPVPDRAGGSTVVDVGGGNGNLLAAVLDRHPGVDAVLLESEATLRTLGADPRTAALADRFRLHAGDALRALDCPADVYLLKQVVHLFDDDTAVRILRNCAAAARPGARVVVIERVLGAGPEAAFTALIDLHMFLVLGGRERTEAEFAGLFARAGLRFSHATPVVAGMHLIHATTRRP